MNLTPDQFTQLDKGLKASFTTQARLEKLVIHLGEQQLHEIAGFNVNLPEARLALIQWAREKGKLHDLIIHAYQMAHHNADLKALAESLLASLTTEQLAIVKPFHDPILLNGWQPIVDRDRLRQRLHQLHWANHRVFVIEGDRRSGRSHSARLIFHAAPHCHYTPVYIDLLRLKRQKGAEEALQPEDIGAQLAADMGFDGLPPRAHEQDSAWTGQFGRWFRRQVSERGNETWWIMIDHVDRLPSISPSINDLLIELTDCCDKLSNVRLILLGYPHANRLKTDLTLMHRLAREKIKPLTEDHILTFFSKFYARRRESLNLQEDQDKLFAARSAKRVLEAIKEEGDDGLELLGALIGEEIEPILEEEM